jgi:flagellar hook-basal body complex protein FliE
MSDIGIQNVLSQIRALKAQAGAAAAPHANAAARPDFAQALGKVVDTVSRNQAEASKMAEAFERGDRSANLAQVMMAMQKAQVSFKALTEVRNRLVQAYQDIQNMPL